jgi:hypothetical protein
MKIEFETINEAFEGENLVPEVFKIMIVIMDLILTGKREGPVYDSNGNKVGKWSLPEPEED